MSAAIRAGYKQTEVGVIPGDWEVQRIGDLATVRSGGTPSREIQAYWNGDIPWITTSQIDFNTISEADQFITEDGLKNSAAKLLPAGTLLMALYGQGKTRGKVGVLDFEAATNQACASINLHGNVSREFLLHFLTSRYEAIRNSSNSGGQENLSGQIVKDIPVAIPPIPEQRAIAAALSDVDALLAKLDEFIAKKRDLKQAAMQQLLTGQTRLPGFSGEWEVKRLGDILSRMANGAVYKPTNSFGLQITRIETIANGTIDYSRTGTAEESPELERYKIIPGDILFSHINSLDHIGKVAIFNGEQALFHGMNLLLLRTNRDAHSHFLYFWFTSLSARRQTRNLAKQAVSQASINTKELKALEIRLPPLLEQTAIATILSDMDTELTALEARRDKTRALKQGMMQELLTGRIRLV